MSADTPEAEVLHDDFEYNVVRFVKSQAVGLILHDGVGGIRCCRDGANEIWAELSDDLIDVIVKLHGEGKI